MTLASPIRVLLVDDSAFALAVLKKLIAGFPDVAVVGAVRSGREALALIPTLNPAVVCTDLDMPGMNGIELTNAIMQAHPRPVLMVSSFLQGEHKGNVSRALEAGAIDVHPKPRGGLDGESQRSARDLVSKIKIAAGVFPLWRGRAPEGVLEPRHERETRREIRVVAIGASVGGPQALNTILRSFPADFPLPILCVQHIGSGFLPGLVDWLGLDCKLGVKIAEPGEPPRPGTAYFPPPGTHLITDGQGRLASSLEPAVSGHRPSVTVTFKSVASFYRSAAAGVLLTGMGEDGAEGLKAIADAGGLTIAQDEQSSVVFGMPRHAIELGAARFVLPIGQIADRLINQVMQRQEH